MQRVSIFVVILGATIFLSCSSNKAGNTLPAAPASVAAVKKILNGTSYKADKAGFRLFSTDKEIKWLEPKPEDKMEKEVVGKVKTTQLNFVNDTSCLVVIAGKDYSGTYVVDDTITYEEKPGIKIRISYVDEEFKFGDGPASMVTYTYIVEGISDKKLLLQTPRSLNSKNIIILMSKVGSKE
jgi:hypothetical protein